MFVAIVIVVATILLVFGLVVFRGAPYVPTLRKNLEQGFKEVYPLGERDLLVDIGSGDGVVLRQAAKCGARAVGYELNPFLVVLSKLLSRNNPLVKIYLADFWRVSLPDETTIVYTFGESRDIEKMYQKVQEEVNRLAKPMYFMSFGFPVKGKEALKTEAGFCLYQVSPLQ